MAIVSPLNVLFVIKGVLGNYISKKTPPTLCWEWSRVSDCGKSLTPRFESMGTSPIFTLTSTQNYPLRVKNTSHYQDEHLSTLG